MMELGARARQISSAEVLTLAEKHANPKAIELLTKYLELLALGGYGPMHFECYGGFDKNTWVMLCGAYRR